MKRVIVLSCIVVLFLMSAPAHGKEHILGFDSHVTVNADSTLTVIETIRVRAERKEIKRGIYRDFPTIYKRENGLNYVTAFDVMEVTRDGRPEDYFVKGMENGKRLYIGRKDYFLARGEYTYTIKYRTDRQIGFFEDHDELDWNVTGNGWVFPIDTSGATIVLPAGADVLDREGFTGIQGSTMSDLTSTVDEDGNSVFRTSRALGPHEGLTVVVKWKKGIVREPSDAMKTAYLFRDAKGLIAGLAGFLIVFIYYMVVWFRVGKDPEGGVIMPRFYPPEKLSPASIRYIMRMGFDDKAFASAVINLAVKGLITIKEKDEEYTLARTEEKTKEPLSRGERKVLNKLLDDRSEKSIKLEQKNHAEIKAALDALKDFLKTEYSIKLFRTNTRYLIPGVIISAISLAFMFIFMEVNPGMIVLVIHALVWPPVFILFSRVAIPKWLKFFRTWKPSHLCGAIAMAPHFLLLAAAVIALPLILFNVSQGFTVYLVILIFTNILFYYLMKAPTALGRKTMDAIEGFRMYLSTAEQDRLNRLAPPERTPELFEKYLPYALALDVEQEWAEQFDDILSEASRELPEGGHVHSWYNGPSSGFSSSFASSLGGSLSSAISSSSTAPGSSGGGGGSSGGGGGGGGGGGW